MIVLLGFAFLAGLATILAPCIWPVLPIVLSSSIAGKEKGYHRPLGVTLGIMLSFAVFTLAVASLVRSFHFNPNILRLVAVVFISLLGFTMIIPSLLIRFEGLAGRFSKIFGLNNYVKGNGFLPGFVSGIFVGIIWSPCAGPILATIATLASIGRITSPLVLITAAYVAGIGIPLFAFAYGGRRFITRSKSISPYTRRIQQAFGVIMIIVAILIYTNYDQVLQVKLLNVFPVLGQAVNGFENSQTVIQQLNKLKNSKVDNTLNTNSLFNTDMKAPDFVGITKWLNTNKPISISDLKGKVVLVDFWTYTCINCIRTLPFVTSWYDKYKSQGFVVIGVHTPEFQFEHDTGNVLNAIKMYNIHYPVAQDNNYATWNAYNNEYWPAEYLIDAKGYMRREHFGEGEYGRMEMAIQALLKESGKKVTVGLDTLRDQTPQTQISPETYLGSKRMQYLYPNGSVGNGQKTFALTDNPPVNSFSYGGAWTVTGETAIAGKDAVIVYHFSADKVFIILRPGINPANTATVKVLLDGKPIDAKAAGQDVKNGILTIDTDRLYSVVDLRGNIEDHILKLEFQKPGIKAYTFTFG